MTLKPWYKVVTPREDLREGRPLDAAEFAVHLDQVRDGRAPSIYQQPREFFERTFLTRNLIGLSAEVVRRLAGVRTETNAVFNMTTQFGGGKTHALTLLYHLAQHGPKAAAWPGVERILDRAGVRSVPAAATAVFVGTEFDSLTGRGGDDGTPLRRTPWGEIAFQLAGRDGLAAVAEHEEQMIAPAGDVLRRFLPTGRPCLILIDEVMNYVSRTRRGGMATQFYNFLQNLSEEARGRDNVVLAVAIPASELEMGAEDQSDYERLKKLLDRLGKAVIMSAETETTEIIRRRLFEWDPRAVGQDGRVILTRDALETCGAYAAWVAEHRQQLPSWFPMDRADEAFKATYPFHPEVISVFERKWRELPRFQQTRGVLRLLALWVARAYQDGFRGAHRDPLIGLGTAPLDDALFRAAAFEQLGESRWEGAVTTDICGKADSHALRLDGAAVDTIRKARLHRKVATAIFFESNGGQVNAEATVPEIRLAVAEPDLDIGNVETALDALSDACYYLAVERNRYRFSLQENLNKRFADRRASIPAPMIEERVRAEVQEVFKKRAGVEVIYFPERSNQIPDRPVLTLVVLPPERNLQDHATLPFVEALTREAGTSARTFKSGLLWAVPESDAVLRDEARKALAWEDIQTNDSARFDEAQTRQLAENITRARRDLREAVWRTYKNVVLLGRDNALRVVDLGLVHSSAADSLVSLIVNRLRQDGDLEDGISPAFLARNWPPAFTEWSTRAVRDAFFASPQFPRLLNGDVVKDTIARGVADSILAYVGKTGAGEYAPFHYGTTLNAADVEISHDMYIITRQTAEAYQAARSAGRGTMGESASAAGSCVAEGPGSYSPAATDAYGTATLGATGDSPWDEQMPPDVAAAHGDRTTSRAMTRLSWDGEVPAQKWMNFYTKVLARYATGPGLRLRVRIEYELPTGISEQRVEETRVALGELGLAQDVIAE